MYARGSLPAPWGSPHVLHKCGLHKCGLTAKDMVILRSDDMAPEGADAMLVTLGRGLESSRMATLPLLLLDANTLEPGGAPYCAAAAFRTATASC